MSTFTKIMHKYVMYIQIVVGHKRKKCKMRKKGQNHKIFKKSRTSSINVGKVGQSRTKCEIVGKVGPRASLYM